MRDAAPPSASGGGDGGGPMGVEIFELADVPLSGLRRLSCRASSSADERVPTIEFSVSVILRSALGWGSARDFRRNESHAAFKSQRVQLRPVSRQGERVPPRFDVR